MTTSDANQRIVMNPLLGTEVVQTPGRMNRREGVSHCPFCEDIVSGRWPTNQETWIRPNDFPPLRAPVGECFIVLYARNHDTPFYALEIDGIAQVVDLWQDVYEQLSQRYACVMTFENSGEEIGQTQRHPHGQTYGVSFIPPTVASELQQIHAHQDATGACLLCDIVDREIAGERIVLASDEWIGFIPQWAKYPYEVHLYARKHLSNLGDMPRNGVAARELATALHQIVRAYNSIYQTPMPYMLVIHQLQDPAYHVHLELLPVGRAPGKLKFAASSESGFGLWLNDSIPEQKAVELRQIIQSMQQQ